MTQCSVRCMGTVLRPTSVIMEEHQIVHHLDQRTGIKITKNQSQGEHYTLECKQPLTNKNDMLDSRFTHLFANQAFLLKLLPVKQIMLTWVSKKKQTGKL